MTSLEFPPFCTFSLVSRHNLLFHANFLTKTFTSLNKVYNYCIIGGPVSLQDNFSASATPFSNQWIIISSNNCEIVLTLTVTLPVQIHWRWESKNGLKFLVILHCFVKITFRVMKIIAILRAGVFLSLCIYNDYNYFIIVVLYFYAYYGCFLYNMKNRANLDVLALAKCKVILATMAETLVLQHWDCYI